MRSCYFDFFLNSTGSCHQGISWDVTYTNHNGLLPDLKITTNNDQSALVATKHLETHRLHLRPIPGSMSISLHRTPQVQLRVDTNLAVCSDTGVSSSRSSRGNTKCSFDFNNDYTPIIQSVTPIEGSAGTRLTITMNPTTILSNTTTSIRLGKDATCDITDITKNIIKCIVSTGGKYSKATLFRKM